MAIQMWFMRARYRCCPSLVASWARADARMAPAEAPTKMLGVKVSSWE